MKNNLKPCKFCRTKISTRENFKGSTKWNANIEFKQETNRYDRGNDFDTRAIFNTVILHRNVIRVTDTMDVID